MKKLVGVLFVLLSILGGPAKAQLTQAQVIADINSMLLSCGNGCNTAASLRALLTIIVQSAFQDPSSTLTYYGAVCNGSTNDDAAISAWLAATVAVGKPAYFTGTCAFNTPIVLPDVDSVTILGSSPGTAVLLYTGGTTNTDIIKIGTAGVPCCAGQKHNLMFANWQIKSNTVMTGGAAVHFAQIVRSNLTNWWVCTQDCANNFYHGVWFDQVDTMRWCGINAQAQQDVVRINGQTGGPASDIWLDCGGKISGGTVGVRIGGGFGGYYCGAVDIIANGINTLIDTTLSGTANTQSFFSSNCVLDSAGVNDLRISDTIATSGTSGIIVLSGAWLASSVSHCMLIDAGVQYPIYFNGGTITNCLADGVHNLSASVRFFLTGTRIANNVGFGISSVVTSPGEVFVSADFVNNSGGNVSSNVVFAASCPAGLPSSSFKTQNGYVIVC